MDWLNLQEWLRISSIKTTGWFSVLWEKNKQIDMPISEPHIRSNEEIFLDAQPIQTSLYLSVPYLH